MATNHLEQLCAEWYEYRGYFVRRNLRQGQREIDLLVIDPAERRLIQVESGVDFDSWKAREERYRKKFDFGADYTRRHFPGFQPAERIAVQVAVPRGRSTLGGGRIVLVSDMLREISGALAPKSFDDQAVPETFPLLRTIQLMIHFQTPTRKP